MHKAITLSPLPPLWRRAPAPTTALLDLPRRRWRRRTRPARRRNSHDRRRRPPLPPGKQPRLLPRPLFSATLESCPVSLIPLLEVPINPRREDQLSPRISRRRDLRHDCAWSTVGYPPLSCFRLRPEWQMEGSRPPDIQVHVQWAKGLVRVVDVAVCVADLLFVHSRREEEGEGDEDHCYDCL